MYEQATKFAGDGELSEIWIRNTQFLNNAIARLSEIRLSVNPDTITDPNSFFLREVGYLIDQGYKVVGDRMVPR